MDEETREKADARFQEALDRTGARDPREFYRGMLRDLRGHDAEAYSETVRRYEEEVIQPIARGDVDPLQTWLEFGVVLAERLHPGRAVVIDETGKAAPFQPPPRWDRLILHLPDEGRATAVPIGLPPELTAAQRAAVDLLALRKVKLPDA